MESILFKQIEIIYNDCSTPTKLQGVIFDKVLNELRIMNEAIGEEHYTQYVKQSIVIHDIVYDVTANDNEERSAEIAQRNLWLISFPDVKIDQCYKQILATKFHEKSGNHDSDLFADSDMAVFGQEWSVYSDYFQNVRKEYSKYPDEVYNQGRINVLTHFLEMESIFKTDDFILMYEKTARKNLSEELKILQQ